MNRCLAVFAIAVLFAVGAFAQTSISATLSRMYENGSFNTGDPEVSDIRAKPGALF